MKKFLISTLLIFNIAHATPITLDQSEIVQGQGMKASTFQNIFTAIENAINNLISKQEVTHVFRGNLNNGQSELIGTSGGIAKFSVQENTSPSVFEYNTNTNEIHIKADGILTINYDQDIIHNCTYATLIVRVNDPFTLDSQVPQISPLIATLNSRTRTRKLDNTANEDLWDGISLNVSTQVFTNDRIKIEIGCVSGTITNIDDGYWGVMSMKWHGVMP